MAAACLSGFLCHVCVFLDLAVGVLRSFWSWWLEFEHLLQLHRLKPKPWEMRRTLFLLHQRPWGMLSPPTPQHSWRFLFTVDSYLCSVRVPFIDRNGWSELLCLSLWSVFIGEEVLISLSVTEKFGYLHPAEGRLRLDSNRTSRPQRLALGQSVAAPLVTLFCRGRRFTCLQPELHQELFSWWSSDFSLVASHQECSGTSGH